MLDTRHFLLTATTTLALAGAPALADKHDMDADSAGATTMQDAGTSIENAAETTGEALENAAEETGEAVSDAAEGAADATAELADDTARAANDLAARLEDDWSTIADTPMSDLSGTEVRTTNGEDVGEIDNFALQNDTLVALVGVGGFLGLGEHDVALEVSRLAYDPAAEVFVVEGYTQEQLEQLPQYDADTLTVLENPRMTLRETVTR